MASSYTSLLKFNQPALGDAGWGTSINNGFTAMVEQAMTGVLSKDMSSGSATLSAIADGVSSEARNQFIVLTGTPAAPASLTVPAGTTNNYKLYFVKNTTSQSVTVTTGGTGVVVPAGKSMIVRVTNAGVEEAMTHAVSLTLTNALAATSGGTGQSSYAVGDLLYASSTTAISKLTVGATNAVLTVAAGIPSWTATLPVASGGTGAATLAANNVLLGNGTSAVQTVAPGTAGNLLTSNGTTWTSSPAPAGGVTSLNSQTGAVVTTGLGDIGSVAVLMIATNTNVAVNSTVAGSDLRYGWTPNYGPLNTASSGYSTYGANRQRVTTAVYDGGGTSLSGVWRKLSTGTTYVLVTDPCTGTFYYYWAAALYVRVS